MIYIFDEVLEIKNGKNQKAVENPKGKYPIYGSGGVMGYADEYICEADTVIIGRKGNINNPIYVSEPFWNVDTAFGLSAKRELLLPKYLFYFCKKFDFEKLNKTVTIPSLTKSDLLKVKIELPDISYQREVITRLSKIEAVIASRKQELLFLDTLIKARFVELFGDPATPGDKFRTCKLGEVADVKSSHRVFTTEFVDEGVPFYRGTEIGALALGYQPEDPYRISMEHYLKIASDDSKPMRGDLLLPSICNKGQVWMVDTDEPFYYKDGRVLCISPNRSVLDSKYLQFYMKMRTEAEYPRLGSGSTFAEFKIFQLKDLEVDIPPLDAQKSFNLFADQVDKSKLIEAKSLNLVFSMHLRMQIFSD